MEMIDIMERAKKQVAAVTGLKPVAVAAAFKDAQGWHISVDMLEMSRIPDSTDVLGTYEVLVDEEGNMVQFERKRTRIRGEPIGAQKE